MTALAQQAAAMNLPESTDIRFHFFGAVCRLAAQDFIGVLETCARLENLPAPGEPSAVHKNGTPPAPRLMWPVESAYLNGLAHLGLGKNTAAARALEEPARTRESPSASQAQALLAWIGLEAGAYEEASRWLQTLDAKKRGAWKLAETLAQTVFLTALEAYALGKFEQAAEKLRAAGKLGCRDRRLGPLLVMSLFRAGQALVYGNPLAVP